MTMCIGIVYLGRRGSGGPISLELAEHLTAHAEVFAVLSREAESLEVWQQSGMAFFTTTTYRTTLEAVAMWLNQVRLERLAAQIRNWHPDVLIYPMFYTLNPFLQLHLHGIPSLVAVHDPVPHPGLRDRVYNTLENLSIRQATRCLLFSQHFKESLWKRGARPGHVDVVPHGPLSYYRRYGPGALEASPDRRNLLFFGRITPYKGLEVLLEAYEQLSLQRSLRLQIVGDGDLGPYLPHLRRLSNVEIINGWVSEAEVDSFFRRAGAIILPYTSASQSGVLTLAASYGLPVVASRVGGIPEQIQDGATGLLVEPNSAAELCQAIERLLDHPEFAATLGRNLEDDYRQNRNWASIAKSVYAACEQAVRDEHD